MKLSRLVACASLLLLPACGSPPADGEEKPPEEAAPEEANEDGEPPLAPADLVESLGEPTEIQHHGLALSPEGELLVSVVGASVRGYTLPQGEEGPVYEGDEPAHEAAFSPDGKLLVVGYASGVVRAFAREGGKPVREIGKVSKNDVVRCVAFSPKGDWIAVGERWAGGVFVFGPEGEEGGKWKAHGEGVLGLSFSPDGASLATAGNDGRLSLWSAPGGEGLWSKRTKVDVNRSPVFSPDGKLLAVCGSDQIKFYDVASGKELEETIVMERPVFGIAFSPDGKWLASADGGGKGLARLLSFEEKSEEKSYGLHGKRAMTTARFHPSGAYFLTGAMDGVVRFYRLREE